MFPEVIYIVISVLLAWTVFIYNKLVIDKNLVLTAWSDIDVQLKRRHDLIPKLADAVKQYTEYESATVQAVTELRTQSQNQRGIADIGKIENQLGDKLRNLIAVAENYPELKASQSFLDLQYNLTDVEDHLQYARRYYNSAVRNLNVRVESFPVMLIARFFGFLPGQFFDFDEAKESDQLQ